MNELEARAPEACKEGLQLELSARFLAMLATLSAADRDLLRICALEERPTREAARELAISAEAARKRWLRLRNRLARRTDLAARIG